MAEIFNVDKKDRNKLKRFYKVNPNGIDNCALLTSYRYAFKKGRESVLAEVDKAQNINTLKSIYKQSIRPIVNTYEVKYLKIKEK